MQESTWLLGVLFTSIALIIILIMKVRLHAFMALVIACFVVGFGAGMPVSKIISTLESGIGGTLGFLIAIIGLGGILGKILEESGGAERLAKTLLDNLGSKRAHWVMAIVGAIAGIPVFFEVGFVLLIPLVYVVARETKINTLFLGIPLAISLMTIHCILPPHPAAMAITVMMGADVGTVIIYGLLVGIPTIIIAGPIWVNLYCGREASANQQIFLKAHGESAGAARAMPGFGITLLTIGLPLILMVFKTATANLPDGLWVKVAAQFVGNPLIALMISVGFAYWSLGLRQRRTMTELLELTQRSFPALANIIFVIGAGGAFNAVLIESGVGKAISGLLAGSDINLIILAWFVAWLMHFAVGSATVAMVSAAGMIHPMLAADPHLKPEILVIAIGAGSIGWAHVTDSAFWVVKEYLNVSLSEALKKFTGGTVVASIVALMATLLLNYALG
ncbi:MULTISPECIES: GntT/GntP/DsdX family permease [Pseudomonas]|jgi:D-serine transporter|uniref:D-serine transporter DsdX n=2 Tax=Pseudomonas TaxID=286 RepID=A0A6L5BQ35_9PSED|nr:MULTISPECIES: gluconate:H+ symporter [Pseudomonas]KAA8552451.1 D-serine transporter DsdX [Pseudomonas marginalis]KAA8560923.1 D-serine transporter DsdX [Pseudomonas extremaustralis]KAF2390380.1 D-serine transporter DsdX [Pseudomonas frederiksbergensis]TWR74340.1 permease DsdX [Pseudomonas marginalis]